MPKHQTGGNYIMRKNFTTLESYQWHHLISVLTVVTYTLELCCPHYKVIHLECALAHIWFANLVCCYMTYCIVVEVEPGSTFSLDYTVFLCQSPEQSHWNEWGDCSVWRGAIVGLKKAFVFKSLKKSVDHCKIPRVCQVSNSLSKIVNQHK